jgi:hypothetical protein
MRTNFTPRGIRVAIAVVAIAAAAFVFRSSVFALLFEPIGWLLWASYRLVASLDQGICWALVVLICSVLVIRLIPARMGAPEQTPAYESRWGSADRITYWEELASRAAESQEGRMAIQANLAALAVAVADGTKQPPPQRSQATGTGWRPALLGRLLAGRRRKADLRAIEEQLAWMESALEIRHEHSVG